MLFAGALAVAVTCESAPGAGRVRCEARVEPSRAVDAGVASAPEIAWADLVVVKTSPFLTALRGRIAPAEASERTANRWTFAFALVARERGTGQVVVRARAVLCAAGGGGCAPVEREASADVERR